MESDSSGFVEVGGTRLFYEVTGQGPCVVLIHAGIAHHRMWDPQFQLLAQTYRVLRYDVRGYHQSVNPEGSYSDHEELRSLLDQVGIREATLIGCSNGGRIALDFALCYPDRVQGLVLVGSAISGAMPSELVQAQWAAIDALANEGKLHEAIESTLRMWVDGPRRMPEQVDPEVRETMRSMLRDLFALPKELDRGTQQPLDPPAIGRLAEIRVPTLVVFGDADVLDICTRCQQLADEIPGSRKVVMTGLAHMPSLERPEEFNRHLLDFLQTPKKPDP